MTTTETQAAPLEMRWREWAMIVLLGFLWGGSFFFARIAVAEIPPLTLVLFRVALAAAALHVYLRVRGISFAPALPLAGSFAMLAILNNVIPFSLMFLGQTELGAGLASVLNATTPFWTIILANAFTADEKITPAKVAGIFLGIAGTAVMIGPGLLADLGGPAWAKFCLVGTAISYGCAAIFAKRFRGMPVPIVATGQLTASTVIMLVVVGLTGFGMSDGASTVTWLSVLALALASTALAYLIYFSILESAGATNASLVTLIVPAFAILLGALVLGERLTAFEIAGMGLIAAGLAVIDGRLLRLWR